MIAESRRKKLEQIVQNTVKKLREDGARWELTRGKNHHLPPLDSPDQRQARLDILDEENKEEEDTEKEDFVEHHIDYQYGLVNSFVPAEKYLTQIEEQKTGMTSRRKVSLDKDMAVYTPLSVVTHGEVLFEDMAGTALVVSKGDLISDWPVARFMHEDDQGEYSILREEIFTLAASLSTMKEMLARKQITLWQRHDGGRITDAKEVDRLYWQKKARMGEICIANGFKLAENLLAMPKSIDKVKEPIQKMPKSKKDTKTIPINSNSSEHSPSAPTKEIPQLWGKFTNKPFDPKSGIPRGPETEESRFEFTNSEGRPLRASSYVSSSTSTPSISSSSSDKKPVKNNSEEQVAMRSLRSKKEELSDIGGLRSRI